MHTSASAYLFLNRHAVHLANLESCRGGHPPNHSFHDVSGPSLHFRLDVLVAFRVKLGCRREHRILSARSPVLSKIAAPEPTPFPAPRPFVSPKASDTQPGRVASGEHRPVARRPHRPSLLAILSERLSAHFGNPRILATLRVFLASVLHGASAATIPSEGLYLSDLGLTDLTFSNEQRWQSAPLRRQPQITTQLCRIQRSDG